MWYVGCVYLGRQILYLHGWPGCEVSGRVVLEHVQTSGRFALSHACLKGWTARCFRQQSDSLVATLWPCYIPFVVPLDSVRFGVVRFGSCFICAVRLIVVLELVWFGLVWFGFGLV